ncbi:hypothetical protein APTSU1_000889700 [Apodemus speciosus]|uniref:Uncharacterized protein n=1 Tax=Apodemus speciosus TaxID=105296 RepID=A0ABQ0F308_APOSI
MSLRRVGTKEEEFSRVTGPFMDQLYVSQDARTFMVFKDQPGLWSLWSHASENLEDKNSSGYKPKQTSVIAEK